MDHVRMATELAKALTFVLEVEQRMTFGKTWSDSRREARSALERYEAGGPDVASELLRVCRRVLYRASPEVAPTLPASLQAALVDMRRVVVAVETATLQVESVGAKTRR